MAQKVRIKDIAEKAGVSVGTVDRILHQRPNVSKSAREKVERVLKEIKYRPNMYASALAYNKIYKFILLIPKHESEAYWNEIVEGAENAVEARQDFKIELEKIYYENINENSFIKAADTCIDKEPDGIVVVPSELASTRYLTDKLHNQSIPFVMLDSYMPDLRPLTFYGQDSFASGYFAGRMLMLLAINEKVVALMKRTKEGKLTSMQQVNREVGFRHYMRDHFPEVKIVDLEIPVDASTKECETILTNFFNNNHGVHHCITLASKAHIVGEFLLRTNRREIQIMGYDILEKNAECLRRGSISFLISQHAFQQGYCSIDALFQAIVLKKEVNPVNYMPIELLSKENIDYYRRNQL